MRTRSVVTNPTVVARSWGVSAASGRPQSSIFPAEAAPSPAMAYALQFLCTLLPTLLIEGLLLFAFGYRSKRSWLVFLLVNLVTQGGFAVYLAVTVLNHGVSGWSLIFYIPIEVIITLVELLLYRRLLTEKNKARAAVYAIAANLCSAVLGLWLIDPLWHFIVSIS